MAALKSFTVHAPSLPAGGDPDARILFVPDTFSLLAFLVPWAYFLWHRMWLVTLAYLLAVAVLVVALTAFGFSEPVRFGIFFVFSLLIGLEARNIRRWTLDRRGYHDEGVVVAPTLDDAERRYFAERAFALAPSLPPGGPPSVYPAATGGGVGSGVIGMFPEADMRARGAK
jgi:Protein of unknown function (DUF2628)